MFYRCVIVSILLFLLAPLPTFAQSPADTCTYTDWAWHVAGQRAVNVREVVTTRAALTPEQRHPTLPCSICREDMTEVSVPGLEPVLMCAAVADDVQTALDAAHADGFDFQSLTGYRVGRTRGDIDESGLRTVYSNHSFGLAIDINAGSNGLYDRCITWSPDCRLRRGGRWEPGAPGSIVPGGPLYNAMREAGLQWSGEMDGRQKDFMHFSVSGD